MENKHQTIECLSRSNHALILMVLCILCLVSVSTMILCSCSLKEEGEGVVSQSSVVSQSDIIINEVLASNSSSAKAFDGRYYDWVELYNPTANTVVLDNYYLYDDLEKPEKCSLKGQKILPGEYLLIYCSGLNMTDEKGYLHTNFKLSASEGETLYLSDDSTMVALNIPASDEDISYGLDSEGERYVWFTTPTPGAPNFGSEIVFNSDIVINEYMLANTFTIYDCEGDYGDWVEIYNAHSQPVELAGYGLTDDNDNPFKYVFPEETVIEPNGYLLIFCDGKNKMDDAGVLHTNFSLSVQDGAISLYNPMRSLCDTMEIVEMPDNISCGRAEGESEPKLFARPTPGKQNATPWVELSARVVPDVNDGVLISETLAATSAKRSKYKTDYIEIYNSKASDINLKGYTLAQSPGEVFFTFPDVVLEANGYLLIYCDGTYKTEDASNLHAPIKIGTSGEYFYFANASGRICDVYASGKGRNGMSSGRIGNDTTRRVFFAVPTPGAKNSGTYYTSYAPTPTFSVDGGVVKRSTSVKLSAPEGYTIVYTTDGSEPTMSSQVYQSPFKIQNNTVIRAAAFSQSSAMSECVTQTYFINNPHTIPIVSISGSKKELISSSGILMDENNGAECKVHFEYFDESGSKAVEFSCGAKHFGAYSRKYPQKALRLSLREVYGQTEVSYPFFNENEQAAKTFSSLLLRPSGQDQERAKLRDELVPAIVRGQIDIDYQEYRACALYINGQYWGLYYIRERLDGDYLKTYYGYEDGTYDLIKSQMFVQEGSLKNYNALTKFCKTNDLTLKENYEYVCSLVDIDSLINFWIIETYFGNYDTGNIRCYKTKNGKWRWMIYDFDWGMHSRSAMENTNLIDEHLLDPKGHGAANFDNSIIRNLLKNEEFQARFITTYCYYIQHAFAPERVVPILNAMSDTIDNEIKLNEQRWGKPKYDDWKNNTVPFLRTYLESKPQIALKQLKSSFHLTDAKLEEYIKLAEQLP